MNNPIVETDLAAILNRIEQRFDKVDQKLDKVNEHLKKLEIGQAKIEEKVTGIDTRLSSLETRVRDQDLKLWGFVGSVFLALLGIIAKLAFFNNSNI
jgi:predicted  nucleic acid-binding Zn-ribbon protein